MVRASCLVFLAFLAPVAQAQPIDATRPEAIEAVLDGGIGALTTEQWREDVRFLADRIRTVHPNPFRFSSRQSFERELAALEAKIPTATPAEIFAGMLRLVALAYDGHTRIQLGFPGLGGGASRVLGLHRLPVRFYAFEDGLTIVATTPEWRRLAGARVTAIGALEADEALEVTRAYVPADNDSAALDRATTLLEIPEMLAAMGLADDPAHVVLTIEREGVDEAVTLPAVAPPAEWVDAATRGSTPLWALHPDSGFWFEWLPDRILYIQYNAVQDEPDESIQAFFGRVFEEAEVRGTERLILDMRFNTGGNNALNWPIVYGLIRSDALNRHGTLFVLIGRRTFSAAQNGINELEKHTQAVFVGEPSGATPNHYGDAARFETANAGIPFFVSTLFWQNHPRDERPWTPPDIFAPPTAEAYLAGRDPALEAIEGWDPRPFFDTLVERLETGGLEAAIEATHAFRTDQRNRFVDIEGDLNRLGYTLLRSDRGNDALRIFRLVAATHPESANAHDSLAEALWREGDLEAAITEYERAIEIDPDGFVGGNATRMLERIRAGEPAP
jgi:hypothetical protein